LCRQQGKVARKCKCQRKLLIVSAVAFALPFLAARPRTKSQRRKKNIKPYSEKKGGDGGLVQGKAKAKANAIPFRTLLLAVIWLLLLASQAASPRMSFRLS